MMYRNLFVEPPPLDVVHEVLKILNLSIVFPYTFQKDMIKLENSLDAVVLLEGYYKPCNDKRILSFTDENRWITILKHVLNSHGWIIVSKETTRDKKKVILYTIQPISTEIENISVDFN
jgi:hypothetical protein